MKPIQTSGVFIVLPVLIVPFVFIIEKNKKRKEDEIEYTTNLGWVGRAANSRASGWAHPKP